MKFDLSCMAYCAERSLMSDMPSTFGWYDVLAYNITLACLLRYAGRQGYEMGLYLR